MLQLRCCVDSGSRTRNLTMNEVLLRVENLKTYFRTVEGLAHAVDGVSFKIRSNEIFALVGESGCGMSVTAVSIIQLVPQAAGLFAGGKIYYRDQEITNLPEVGKRKIRGDEIAMIFQEPMTSLNPVFTVGNQITWRSRSTKESVESSQKCQHGDVGFGWDSGSYSAFR